MIYSATTSVGFKTDQVVAPVSITGTSGEREGTRMVEDLTQGTHSHCWLPDDAFTSSPMPNQGGWPYGPSPGAGLSQRLGPQVGLLIIGYNS